MIRELHTTRFWLTSDGRLEVYDHKLAKRLNKYYKRYDNGAYKFLAGEEAVFTVAQNEYNHILYTFLAPKLARQAEPVG